LAAEVQNEWLHEVQNEWLHEAENEWLHEAQNERLREAENEWLHEAQNEWLHEAQNCLWSVSLSFNFLYMRLRKNDFFFIFSFQKVYFNPLSAELNPTCPLLALF
jgi:hypothetical protein